MFSLLKEFTEALIMALVVFFFLQVSVQNFRVEGSSMAPSMESGEYVTVNKLYFLKLDVARFSRLIPFWDASDDGEVFPFRPDGPRRGGIVVFRFPSDPNRSFVKRIIGLPGEQVSIKRGVTYVDDQKLDEPYVKIISRDETVDFPVLAEDHYFVMGDNRPYSNDSRNWGSVPLARKS
jgi:signal peptidase I